MDIEEERKKREPAEILRLSGCLDNVDKDVANMCIKILPKGKQLISVSDLMEGVQDIKNKLKQTPKDLKKVKLKDLIMKYGGAITKSEGDMDVYIKLGGKNGKEK